MSKYHWCINGAHEDEINAVFWSSALPLTRRVDIRTKKNRHFFSSVVYFFFYAPEHKKNHGTGSSTAGKRAENSAGQGAGWSAELGFGNDPWGRKI